MSRRRIPAAFIRGGTSKGVFFHARDLPESKAQRNAIFLEVLGSPDPYARQLNGLGGGMSSLSKAVVISPSGDPDRDVDYTFAQIEVASPMVDYSATCGNLSSAVGPFAVDEGLVGARAGNTMVRVFNTNTQKHFEAHFEVRDGATVEEGGFVIPGVAGAGARVCLDYLDPGGSRTGALLPTGVARDRVEVAGLGVVELSMVDAANPAVFVAARELGLSGFETPQDLEAQGAIMDRLEHIRRIAGVCMGIAHTPESVPLATPKVATVAPPEAFVSTGGTHYLASHHDIGVRMLSMGKVHRVVPLTGAMCLAAACEIPDSVPNEVMNRGDQASELRIGNPAGVVPVGAQVGLQDGTWTAQRVRTYRTQRRLMEGWVLANP